MPICLNYHFSHTQTLQICASCRFVGNVNGHQHRSARRWRSMRFMNSSKEAVDAVPRRQRWMAMDTLFTVGGVLLGLNALHILLVAFGNITDFATNQAFVQHVLSMDTTNFGAPEGQGLDPA